jgi:glycogen synthase
MRVCHVWDRFWPLEIGGVERYIQSLTSYLHKTEGIDFSLITGRTKILLVTKNIPKKEDAGFLQVHRLGPNPVDLVYGASLRFLGSRTDFVERMKFAGLCYEAERCDLAKSADIFHIHGIWSDLESVSLGVYLSQHFHKPLVLTLHGGFIGNPLMGGMPLQKPAVSDILFHYADAITTYSNTVLDSLRRMGLGEKSHLVTNFVDTTQFKNSFHDDPERENTVVFVGRLEPLQTPLLVVKAFKQVKERYPNAKLQIVGYGRLYETTKELIHNLDLDQNVTLVGKQSDVRKFLWSSEIFVATNFGYIASLEGWAAGLSLIAPYFGVLKETVIHETNGLLVAPNDVDDLARALLRLFEDRNLRKKLAFNGLEKVKNYDTSVVAPKIADIYRSVVNDR